MVGFTRRSADMFWRSLSRKEGRKQKCKLSMSWSNEALQQNSFGRNESAVITLYIDLYQNLCWSWRIMKYPSIITTRVFRSSRRGWCEPSSWMESWERKYEAKRHVETKHQKHWIGWHHYDQQWFAYRLSGHELLPETKFGSPHEDRYASETFRPLAAGKSNVIFKFLGLPSRFDTTISGMPTFQACQHRFCFPGDFFAWASTPQPTFGSPKTGLKFLKKTLDPGTVCRGPQLWKGGETKLQLRAKLTYPTCENLRLPILWTQKPTANPVCLRVLWSQAWHWNWNWNKNVGRSNESQKSQATFGSFENSARSCGETSWRCFNRCRLFWWGHWLTGAGTESTDVSWKGGLREAKPSLPLAGYQCTRHRFKASQRQGGFLDFGPVPATWLAGSCRVRNEIEAGFLGPKIIRNRKQASRERGCWGRPVFFWGWGGAHHMICLERSGVLKPWKTFSFICLMLLKQMGDDTHHGLSNLWTLTVSVESEVLKG